MPKRANLSNAQYSSIIPAKGYQVSPYSTGYDRVIGTRVGDDFVFVAKDDGVVTKVTKDRILVEYDNLEEKKAGSKLGVTHGNVAGTYVAHTFVTDLTKGHRFKQGDVIAWHRDYFERDLFDAKNVVMKLGALSFVALVEGNDTLEDGSAISSGLSEGLTATLTKRKTILVDFTQEIDIKKEIGTDVEYTDVLCTISNYIEGIERTDASRQTLEMFSGTNPKAGFSGTVTGMELIYMGDKDDMSPKLRELADRFDNLKAKDAREFGGKRATSCKINRSTFFGGERVEEDTLALSFYIDTEAPSGVGDKTVFASQLKSIHGRVMSGVNETESGLPLGARFGLKSVFARIVGSAFIAGGFNRVIHWGTKRFAVTAMGG